MRTVATLWCFGVASRVFVVINLKAIDKVGDLCRYSVYLSMTVVSPRTEEAIKKYVEFMIRNSLHIVEAVVRYQQRMGASMSVASGHWNIFKENSRRCLNESGHRVITFPHAEFGAFWGRVKWNM